MIITRDSSPEWFSLYRIYCDDTYLNIEEYFKHLEDERLEKEKGYDPLSVDFIVSEYDDKGPLPDKVVFEQK